MLPYLLLVLLINAKAAAIDQSTRWRSLDATHLTTASLSPQQPSFFSAYSPPEETRETEVAVHCKLSRPISNLDQTVTIIGVVQQDLVSSKGKIIVPAGSKVVGEGYCDAERNRIMAKNKWSLYVSDHLIRATATMFDPLNSEGLKNSADPNLNEPGVRQAIYRDGAYVSVNAGSDFLLRVTGNISIEDLNSAFLEQLPSR
jgi:hypothetical protein